MEEIYDYRQAVTDDVLDYISNSVDLRDYSDREELAEELNNLLWDDDAVTGNGSGNYTFSAYCAEEYLNHNWDLLEEAMAEFGCDENPIEQGAEWCDVTIRCYLLGECIESALDELESNGELTFAEDEDEEA